MNKQAIYELLSACGVRHEITEHQAVYNMEQLSALSLPHPETEAKNLFLRDAKKQNYYLITLRGDQRVDLKALRPLLGKLSFGSPPELMELLELTPGSVSPLGLLNDEAHRVTLYLDQSFSGEWISVHPNDNTATVCLQADDLVHVLTQRGCKVLWLPLEA